MICKFLFPEIEKKSSFGKVFTVLISTAFAECRGMHIMIYEENLHSY